MKKQIVFDFTRFEETLSSLSNYLNVSEERISRYALRHKDTFNVEDFLEEFEITDEKLLNIDLLMSSLHVTTNNDKCESIKKYGLISLQKAIELDTPLSNFLKSRDIFIDVQKKEIQYKDKVFDLGKNFESVSNPIDAVIRKLYMDYQINSFFNYGNVLTYGVQNNPEFLFDLSNLLKENLTFEWFQRKNDCYVLKINVPLDNIEDYTFLDEHNKENFSFSELELLKRKWIIKQSFEKLNDDFFYSSMGECYCYLKVGISIPSENIVNIYSPEEYREVYRIND
ncbi:hypothetical protein AEA09_14810 [Lysinibacillus contaminans]|uniref:HTH merR-type domain-containing protein n=1 Tax=Lysinibacillus contaminans TaxID=1293441 RepID=A0ABR5JXU0_9BACI|nr:hypothetical protein [Lysinibacillus contaminans]KOS67120.1 hypothetical protein AEA09_14810 [Lysinibacillus contaminans]